MPRQFPKVEYTEQSMREGMQIEDANIPVQDKIKLLDALSETGLKEIVVGSFVSPRYTPQMARIDEIVQGFHPQPGVRYTCLTMNERGIERAKQYIPPLSLERRGPPSLSVPLDDIFQRRNANRPQFDSFEQWPRTIARAQEQGAKEAGIGVGHPWGGNFIGRIPAEVPLKMLEKEHELWDEVGIKVTHCSLGDTMGWNMPHLVKETLVTVKERWPEITNWSFHLHNARGTALATAWTILDALSPEDSVHLDGTIGGFGGCPYCGHGRATAMMPTEDLVNMLEEMGVDVGVDLDKLVECVWMAEEILARPLMGHVSKAGRSPRNFSELFGPNIPFVETLEQARHFRLGKSAYEGGIYPWREPITSPYRDRLEKGLPAYEIEGDWPWNQDFFPKPSGKK
ncbi:MAG: citramalate synthase [Chloroflexi bacterium]|nr:citramalate synthase [Chloroflexota bacterium]